MKIDAILSPRELPALAGCSFGQTTCIVFDVLRATSTFVTALHHDAKEVIPVAEISEALALRRERPNLLLGGERDGLRISAEGIDFDIGNSPREYSAGKVRGRTIVSTTTNGTRALRACAGARTVLAASFLNLGATADFLVRNEFRDILLVCAGTRENPALEDILAAGALCELLKKRRADFSSLSESAEIALQTFVRAKENLSATVATESENAQRLLAIPELRDDVEFCLRRDVYPLVARMKNGRMESGGICRAD